MPNFHNKKLFSDALNKVSMNDKYITETYKHIQQTNPNTRPQELNEIVGEILGGLAAGALMVGPSIAKAMGAREEQRRYEREQSFKEAEARKKRKQELTLQSNEFGQQTSERLGRETYESDESQKERSFKGTESQLERDFRKGESAAERGFQAGENALARTQEKDIQRAAFGQQTSERLGAESHRTKENVEGRKFRRGERLGAQRYGMNVLGQRQIADALRFLAQTGSRFGFGGSQKPPKNPRLGRKKSSKKRKKP